MSAMLPGERTKGNRPMTLEWAEIDGEFVAVPIPASHTNLPPWPAWLNIVQCEPPDPFAYERDPLVDRNERLDSIESEEY